MKGIRASVAFGLNNFMNGHSLSPKGMRQASQHEVDNAYANEYTLKSKGYQVAGG